MTTPPRTALEQAKRLVENVESYPDNDAVRIHGAYPIAKALIKMEAQLHIALFSLNRITEFTPFGSHHRKEIAQKAITDIEAMENSDG